MKTKFRQILTPPPISYAYKNHEQPFMIGSPGMPDHPVSRKIMYGIIGLLLAIVGGLQNGLLIAILPQLQGSLGLTPVEGGWILVAYYMVNACVSILLFKCRQQFGLARFVQAMVFALVVGNAMQVAVHSYESELWARALSGLAANGMTVLSMFYLLQAVLPQWKSKAVIASITISQIMLPAARAFAPSLFDDGNIQAVFYLQLGMSVAVLAGVSFLPLPHGYTSKVFSWLDIVSFGSFAIGVAALCAFLVQGRIIWWDHVELGWLLLGALLFIGTTLLIENNRREPMMHLDWLGSKELLWLGMTGAFLRVVMSEQNFGSAGLLTALGMGATQLQTYYWVLSAGALCGLIFSVSMTQVQSPKPPIMLAFFCIALGSFMDVGADMLTRPYQAYVSQFLLAMASACFIGPLMMEGMLRAFARGPQYIITFNVVFALSQTLGGLLGSAALSTFITLRTKEHVMRFGEQLSQTDPQVAARIQAYAAQYHGINPDGAWQQTQGVVSLVQQAQQQATVLAYNDSFWLFGIVASIGFTVASAEWLYFKWRGASPMAPVLAKLAADQVAKAKKQNSME